MTGVLNKFLMSLYPYASFPYSIDSYVKALLFKTFPPKGVFTPPPNVTE